MYVQTAILKAMDYCTASGFDWDEVNLEKCRKHGLAIDEIEAVFHHQPAVAPDLAHSQAEQRLIAIGKGMGSRPIFIVFTLREIDDEVLIRPISARYMHQKEIDNYEEETARPIQ